MAAWAGFCRAARHRGPAAEKELGRQSAARRLAMARLTPDIVMQPPGIQSPKTGTGPVFLHPARRVCGRAFAAGLSLQRRTSCCARFPLADAVTKRQTAAFCASDMASMEHPLFSLATQPDMRHLVCQSRESSLEIIPSGLGLPTIKDKDILIFCISQLMDTKNRGEPIGKRVNIGNPPRKQVAADVEFSRQDACGDSE